MGEKTFTVYFIYFLITFSNYFQSTPSPHRLSEQIGHWLPWKEGVSGEL